MEMSGKGMVCKLNEVLDDRHFCFILLTKYKTASSIVSYKESIWNIVFMVTLSNNRF